MNFSQEIPVRKSSANLSLIDTSRLKTAIPAENKRNSGYYAKRRSNSNANNRFSGSLSFALSEPTLPASPGVSESPISLHQTDLIGKPREELLRLCSKLHADISMKNKLIHEMNCGKNWNIVNTSLAQEHTDRIRELSFKGVNSYVENEEAKIKLFQTLLEYKKGLDKNRDAIEQNNALLRQLQSQNTCLEEESAHLKTLVAASNSGQAMSLERKRVLELEAKLDFASKDILGLQSKIELWARSNKRNQEARMQAEASLRILEYEIDELKACPLESRYSRDIIETPPITKSRQLRSIDHSNDSLAENTDIQDLERSLYTKSKELDIASAKINESEQAIRDVVTIVEDLERENAELRIRVETSDYQLEERNRQLESTKQAAAANDKDLHARIQVLSNDEISNLSMQLSQMEQESRVQADNKSKLETSLNASQIQINLLIEENEDVVQISNALKVANADLVEYRKSLDSFASERQRFESIIIDLNEQNEQKSRKLDELLYIDLNSEKAVQGPLLQRCHTEDLFALQATLDEQILKSQNFDKLASTAANEVQVLQRQLVSLNTSSMAAKELSEELKESKSLVNLLENELSRTNAELENMKNLPTAIDSDARLTGLEAELANSKMRLQGEMDRHELNIDARAQDLRGHEHMIAEVRAKLGQAQADLESEREEHDLILQSNDELTEKVLSLTNMLAQV